MNPVDRAAEIWRKRDDLYFATEQAKSIFREILPDVLARFVEKNADYGDDTAAFLGAKGQFADINPKFWKLKKALWDGEKLEGEPVEEILADLIGHCLLTLHFLNEQKPEFLAPEHAPWKYAQIVNEMDKDQVRKEYRLRFPSRPIADRQKMVYELLKMPWLRDPPAEHNHPGMEYCSPDCPRRDNP